jgi:hypothetical protein
MEAIVDAYNCDERAMGWYYYLHEVLGMAPEEECESEMFVWVRQTDARIAVPLGQLQPLSKHQETQEAVGDWLYWVDRGYEL